MVRTYLGSILLLDESCWCQEVVERFFLPSGGGEDGNCGVRAGEVWLFAFNNAFGESGQRSLGEHGCSWRIAHRRGWDLRCRSIGHICHVQCRRRHESGTSLTFGLHEPCLLENGCGVCRSSHGRDWSVVVGDISAHSSRSVGIVRRVVAENPSLGFSDIVDPAVEFSDDIILAFDLFIGLHAAIPFAAHGRWSQRESLVDVRRLARLHAADRRRWHRDTSRDTRVIRFARPPRSSGSIRLPLLPSQRAVGTK